MIRLSSASATRALNTKTPATTPAFGGSTAWPRAQGLLQPDKAYHGLVGVNGALAPAAHPLLEPMTHMNLSGSRSRRWHASSRSRPTRSSPSHDELDLSPGEMKLKKAGHRGYNGLKDMKPSLAPATSGVCARHRPPWTQGRGCGYVLRKPPLAERQAVEDCIEKSYAAELMLLRGDMDKASPRSTPSLSGPSRRWSQPRRLR